MREPTEPLDYVPVPGGVGGYVGRAWLVREPPEQLDGAFLVSNTGVVLSAARYIDAASDSLDLPLGLGSRHTAGASIFRQTRAVTGVVSESSMVRMLAEGELVSEIVPELWMIDGYTSRMEGRIFTRRDEDITVIGRAE